MKNLFIVFDGMDGSGKSTQLSLLHDYLFGKDKSIRILSTREPTYGKYGRQIRQNLKTHKNPYTDADKLMDLFIKDRQDHINGLIRPFMKKDFGNVSIVLCDRYYYSTIAYQHAQGIEISKLIKMNQKFLKPDLAIILDLHPETALRRISKERSVEKFEKIEFMKELRKIFNTLPQVMDDNITIIDTSGSEEETFAQIKRQVDKLIRKKR